MRKIEDTLANAPLVEQRIGYSFKDRSLLALAFIHRSFVNENKEVSLHNERLEFLGDSLLGMIMAEYLYTHLPENPEGELSYLRSRLVEAPSCVSYIQKLNVEEFILLGKGERMSTGRGRDTILADLFEAILGAVYLDGGLEAAKHFIFKNCTDEIEAILKTPLRNWKALLQDYCQKKFQKPPHYLVTNEEGPDHSKIFKVIVLVDEIELGTGQGASKKLAQQDAAADALSRLAIKE